MVATPGTIPVCWIDEKHLQFSRQALPNRRQPRRASDRNAKLNLPPVVGSVDVRRFAAPCKGADKTFARTVRDKGDINRGVCRPFGATDAK